MRERKSLVRKPFSVAKAKAAKAENSFMSLLFIFCTLLMLASVIRMWSHWFEISATLGFDRATIILASVTGAALFVSWWVNTDNG